MPSHLRVVLGSSPHELELGGGVPWRLDDAWGRTHVRDAAATWRVERSNRRLRVVSKDGRRQTAWSEEPFAVIADGPASIVPWNGHRYRGELRLVATDTAIIVVNVVGLEEYLRGVVPIEIGRRAPNEIAAVEAQAIAARSYTVVRALEGVTKAWDLTARPTDQVYGGVDAETALSDSAIAATAGQVLTYGGQPIRAPYHSTCGGATASPRDVWRGGQDAWLRGVSDLVPGTNRAWCEISPRFAWERVIDERALLDAVASQERGRRVARITMARVAATTPSGRVRELALDTEAGTVTLSGNDMRFALRDARGEWLNSTYFSLEPTIERGGRLTRLTLRGRGNGHGVGMCQWGAIGRARAGMASASILEAYYPGTVIARVQSGVRSR
ncbi:MAG: SpoIID/LytB domain-containing protein [Gemmatimonadaceae bacterium]|nr:SpoIID/LytB domain-containing protein [Gemmatimonadaceae bacterium]